MTDNTNQQMTKAEKLQDLWLDAMIAKLEDGSATSTDFATLLRFLENNGWTVDPTKIPSDLKDMLSSQVSFDDPVEDDAVLPIDRKQA
jgi:hypothetical protein